jgi:hypothetical protein
LLSYGEKKNVNRKYDEDYLKMKFYWTSDQLAPYPLCVVWYDTLSNDAMKHSKLSHYFQTKHADLAHKPVEYLRNKHKEMLSFQKSVTSVAAGEEGSKTIEASFQVALVVAKPGQGHNVAETLVTPAAKLMANIMLGEKAGRAIDKILLSNDMIQRRIRSLASNLEAQLITRVRGSSYFALKLDGSTDVENFCQI